MKTVFKLTFTAIFCVWFLSLVPLRGQSTVNFYLTQFTGTTNDTTITIKAQNNPVIYNGQFYWWPANGTNIATTNGFATILLAPSKYNVSLAGVAQSWTITVTNSATALNAAGLTTSTVIYNGINSINGNAVTNDGHGNYTVTGGTNVYAPGYGILFSNNTVSINPSNALPVALVVTNNDSQPITLTNINNQITAQFSSQALGDAFDTPWLQVTNNLNDDILQDAYIGGDNGLPDLWMLSDTAGTGALQIFTNSTVFMGNQNGFVDVASNGSVYIGNGFPQGSGSGAEFVPGVAGAHYAVVTTGEFFGNGGGLTNATTALPANTNGLVSAAQAATIAAQYAGGNGLNVTLYFTNTLPAAQVISNYFTDLIPTSWQFYLICTNTDTATGLKPGNTIPIEAINAANALFAGQANAAEPSFLPLIGTNYVIVNSPNSFNFGTAANWKYPTLAPGYASPTATVNFNLISIITGTHTNQGGGGSWTPTSESSLLAWWNPTTIGLANGASIPTWADSSTHGNTLTSYGTDPLYETSVKNGQPATLWSSATMRSSLTANTQPFTIGFVFNTSDVTDDGVILGDTTGNSSVSVDVAGGDLRLLSQNTTLIGQCAVSANTWYIALITYDGSGDYGIWINAVSQASGTSLLTFSGDTIQLGQKNASGGDFYAGYLGDFTIFNVAFNSTQRANFFTWANAKWAVY